MTETALETWLNTAAGTEHVTACLNNNPGSNTKDMNGRTYQEGKLRKLQIELEEKTDILMAREQELARSESNRQRLGELVAIYEEEDLQRTAKLKNVKCRDVGFETEDQWKLNKQKAAMDAWAT